MVHMCDRMLLIGGDPNLTFQVSKSDSVDINGGLDVWADWPNRLTASLTQFSARQNGDFGRISTYFLLIFH